MNYTERAIAARAAAKTREAAKPIASTTRTPLTANPWLPETRNLTEQARITKADPARAAALRASAAKTVASSATTVNPWASASLNYTEQVRILKSDPSRALKLRAAAHIDLA